MVLRGSPGRGDRALHLKGPRPLPTRPLSFQLKRLRFTGGPPQGEPLSQHGQLLEVPLRGACPSRWSALAGLALLLITLRWSRPVIPSSREAEDATPAPTPGPGVFRAALGMGTWASTSRLQFGGSCPTVCGQG